MFAGARVLVTGAAGFLGANLVRALIDQGADVVALTRRSTNVWRLHDLGARLRIVRAELEELPDSTELSHIDIVYHLASAGVDQRMHDVPAMIRGNIAMTDATCALAERLGAARLVHVGSSVEYGPGLLLAEDHALAPTAEYGATKAGGTLLAQAHSRRTGLPLVVVRPFSVFGPWEAGYRLIPYCILRALAGKPIEITSGTQTRDFVFVDDVMRLLLAAGTLPDAIGETFNVATGVSTSVRQVAERISDMCGLPPAAVAGTRPHQTTEMWMTSGDSTRAGRILGWQPRTSLDDALRTTVAWFDRARVEFPSAYA